MGLGCGNTRGEGECLGRRLPRVFFLVGELTNNFPRTAMQCSHRSYPSSARSDGSEMMETPHSKHANDDDFFSSFRHAITSEVNNK